MKVFHYDRIKILKIINKDRDKEIWIELERVCNKIVIL